MTYIDSLVNFILNLISTNYNFIKNFSTIEIDENFDPIIYELILYVKFSSGIINITLYLLLVLIILNFIYYIFFKNVSYLITLLKFINLFFITFIIILLFLKFYFSLKLEQHLGPYLYDIKLNFFLDSNINSQIEYFIVFSSSLSDAILILYFITGLICLELLASKNLFKNINNVSLFYFFNIFVTIMVSTNNILIMFISFELIFLPTMYFVYKLGYSNKIDKANSILFY